MGQVVTDDLVHEIGNRAPVVVVRAGFHHSTEDVVTPPAECSDYVADMSVMELVSENGRNFRVPAGLSCPRNTRTTVHRIWCAAG